MVSFMEAIKNLISSYNKGSEETSAERVNERFIQTIKDVNSELRNPGAPEVFCYTTRETIDGISGDLTPVVGKDGVLHSPEDLKIQCLSASAEKYAGHTGVNTDLENFAAKVSVDGQKYLVMEGKTRISIKGGREGYLMGVASLKDDKNEWEYLNSFFGKDQYQFLPIEDAPEGMRDMTAKEISEMPHIVVTYNVAFPEDTRIEFGPYKMVLDKMGAKEAKIARLD